MKLPSRLAAALAASLALLSHGSVMAAATASATISNVQFGALDLTPNDGISAGYDINDFSTRLYANLRSSTENLTQFIRPDPYLPATVGYERGPSHTWSTSGGAIGELGANAAAHPNLAQTSLMATTLQEISLTLRPYSVLTVSGHFSFFADEAPATGLEFGASGQTTALLEVDGKGRYTAGRAFWTDGLAPDIWEEDFLLTYGNNSNHDIQLSLSFYTAAAADSYRVMRSIPEPGTWSMLGAGLAVVGVAARRRRRVPRQERRA